MLNNVSITIDNTPIFRNVCLCVTPNNWISILGKSGCGKSTLLRILAKLQVAGTVTGDISAPKTVAWMGQQDYLHDWATVLDNALLPKRIAGRITHPHKQRATKLLQQVGIGDKIHAYPYQLSGGQRQRVALVRTLMTDAPVVLMDEPFSALDSITKDTCQNLFYTMLHHKTVIMVTHDCMEALKLSDTVYILDDTLKSVWQATTPAPRLVTDTQVVKGYKTIWQRLMGGRP